MPTEHRWGTKRSSDPSRAQGARKFVPGRAKQKNAIVFQVPTDCSIRISMDQQNATLENQCFALVVLSLSRGAEESGCSWFVHSHEGINRASKLGVEQAPKWITFDLLVREEFNVENVPDFGGHAEKKGALFGQLIANRDLFGHGMALQENQMDSRRSGSTQ